jgi:hypothetical protein
MPSTSPDTAWSGRRPWPELEIQRDLATAKLPATLQLGPLPFAVASHGWGKYRYCLEHPIGQVDMTASRHLPAVRVQPRSEFLHAVGPEKAVAVFSEPLADHSVALQFSVSRVDLYADVTGFASSSSAGGALCLPGGRQADL